jgi:glycosyltransferase involved in cell wall biosynthesis
VLYILSDYRGSYHHLIDRLEESGAELIELEPHRRLDRTISKAGIVRQLLTPRLPRLRGRWGPDDTLLIISWYVLPVLLLLRLRILPWPRRIIAMAVFVHDDRLRRVVNVLLRAMRPTDVEFIAFSRGERRNLIERVGVPVEQVHLVLYRGSGEEPAARRSADAGYVFSGGYSNRDYDTLLAAVAGLDSDVVVVASALNDIDGVPGNVRLHLDVSWDDFDELIAACAVLIIPLHEGGEASGQNVLFRGIHHGRPVIATRHDALVDYLGDDYPGFVPAADPLALCDAIERALNDAVYRAALVDRVELAGRWLAQQEGVETEIAAIVTG